MASYSKQRSFVADVIKFDASDNPPWRSEVNDLPNVSEMVKKIVQFQQEWIADKENYDSNNVSSATRDIHENFIFHCNKEEGHGCGTLEETRECLHEGISNKKLKFSQQENETKNLERAYKYLMKIKQNERDDDLHGYIEESMLRDANEIILDDIERQKDSTKPGVYSNRRRITKFHGELYEYQLPPDMQDAVNKILDQYNSLYRDSQNESDEEKVYKLFKSCSWFVFEMLDLHPFGDGNGRLCRLLCSYVLSTCTPFPTPIYNVWSKSSKDDYKVALKAARNSADRHPCSLTTMIIECNWYAWKHFMVEVKQGKPMSGHGKSGKQ